MMIAQLFFENNTFIINSEHLNSKICIDQLIKLLKNSRFHIEFYSKLFIMIKHGLKNEIIKLNVNFFLWNFNQMVIINFWRVKIGPCFQKSFWNYFFSFVKIYMPNVWIHNWLSKWAIIFMDFMGFSFKIFKMISLYQLITTMFFNMGFDLFLKGFIND